MRLSRTLLITLSIAALTSTGCASRPGSPSFIPLRHDVISAREVEREDAASAYDLVERLRPNFLRTRGSLFDGMPLVYVDDVLLGDVNMLRTVHARDVREIRYVRGEDMLFRSQEASGRRVIQVITRRD